MEEIICYTNYLPEGTEQNISFMELLLNDNWANGKIQCSDSIFNEVGTLNTKLLAKQNYEFLLRVTRRYPLKAIGISDCTYSISNEDLLESFRTDCYIAGKYQQELLASGNFNPVIETLLTNASQLPDSAKASLWLEKMISHAPEYYEIDDNTRPILIYKGTDACYNTLNIFSQKLADSFLAYKQRVEIFNVETEGNQSLTKYIGQHFKAIIGIQTYAFSIMMQDNTTNLHDLIIGPKYNMILDHPAWMKEHVIHAPKDYYFLVHDRNYMAFSNRYFKNAIKECIYFPPGGILPHSDKQLLKCYDISFIGCYRNYRERLQTIYSYDRKHRFLAARYIGIMKNHPEYPAEKALHETLAYYHIELSDTDFLDLFYEMGQCYFCVMLYYREKILQVLLDAGIEVHVYSESWGKAPFANHPCLFCHPGIDIKESLLVMQQSRLSLNIMSWHKDGLTERVLNAMLCQSVVISDKSTGLEETFVNGKDIVLFDLTNLKMLPTIVKNLLADHKKLQEISINGYNQAVQNHLWAHRAMNLLQLLDS